MTDDIFFAITPITPERTSPHRNIKREQDKVEAGTNEGSKSSATKEERQKVDVESLMRQIDEFQLQSDLDLIQTLQTQKSRAQEELRYYALQQQKIDKLLYEALQMAKMLKDAINTYYQDKKATEVDCLAYWDIDDYERYSDGMITTWI